VAAYDAPSVPLALRPAFVLPLALLLVLLYGVWAVATAEPPAPPTVRSTIPVIIGGLVVDLDVRDDLSIEPATDVPGDHIRFFADPKLNERGFRRVDELLANATRVPIGGFSYLRDALCGPEFDTFCDVAHRVGGWSVDLDFIYVAGKPRDRLFRLPSPPSKAVTEVVGDMTFLRDGSFQMPLDPARPNYGVVTCSSAHPNRNCNAWMPLGETLGLRVGFGSAPSPDPRAIRAVIARARAYVEQIIGQAAD